jgi:hypothetical protein
LFEFDNPLLFVRLNRLPELPEMRLPRALDTLCATVKAHSLPGHILDRAELMKVN